MQYCNKTLVGDCNRSFAVDKSFNVPIFNIVPMTKSYWGSCRQWGKWRHYLEEANFTI